MQFVVPAQPKLPASPPNGEGLLIAIILRPIQVEAAWCADLPRRIPDRLGVLRRSSEVVEPDVDDALTGEVACREIPTLHLPVVDDDALIPQQRNVESRRQGAPLELVDEALALNRIDI